MVHLLKHYVGHIPKIGVNIPAWHKICSKQTYIMGPLSSVCEVYAVRSVYSMKCEQCYVYAVLCVHSVYIMKWTQYCFGILGLCSPLSPQCHNSTKFPLYY